MGLLYLVLGSVSSSACHPSICNVWLIRVVGPQLSSGSQSFRNRYFSPLSLMIKGEMLQPLLVHGNSFAIL